MPSIEELQRFQFQDFTLENSRRVPLTVLGEHAFGMEQGRIVTSPVAAESEGGGGEAAGDEAITVHFLLQATLIMPLYDEDLDDFVDTNVPLEDSEDDLTTSIIAAIPSLGGDVSGTHGAFNYHFNYVIGGNFNPSLYPSGTFLTDMVLPCEGSNNFGVSGGFLVSLDPTGGTAVGTFTTPVGNFTIYATGETTEITSFDATLTVS